MANKKDYSAHQIFCAEFDKLAKANPKIATDYSELKKTFNQALKNLNYEKEPVGLPFVFLNMRWNYELPDSYIALIYNDYKEMPYVITYYPSQYGYLKGKAPKFVEMINKIPSENLKNIDFYYANKYVTLLEKYSDEATDEEYYKTLKKIKKVWYSNIIKGDDWKQLIVKIELIIKSLE